MGAAELFDELVQGGWARVQEWIADEREESLHLDFKGRHALAPSDTLQDVDKEVLGKAASGFANVDGGVLVLGLSTKDRSKGDPNTLAREQGYLPDAVALQRAVQKHLKDLVLPRLAGLDVRAITEPGASRGVVAILVPRSDGRPHRASSISSRVNNRYYMRTDTDTVAMPHEMLGALFGSVPAPRLRLIVGWKPPAQREPAVLSLYMRNDGPGTARAPVLALELIPGQSLLHAPMVRSEANYTSSGSRMVVTPSQFSEVLYPGIEDLLIVLVVEQALDGNSRKVTLRGTLCALDAMPTHFDETIEFAPGEVVTIPRDPQP